MDGDALRRAFASTRAVLVNVDVDSLENPTPCRSWNIAQVVNHVVTAPRFGVSALQGGEAQSDEADYSQRDFVAAYDTTRDQTLAAFGEAGALERMVKLPFAEVPGSFVRMMITTDQFTHGWDLARATGQSTDLDPELATELLAQAAIPDQFRGEDGVAPFGPVQPAPSDASAADKLAAHLGRHM